VLHRPTIRRGTNNLRALDMLARYPTRMPQAAVLSDKFNETCGFRWRCSGVLT
jgi:hypothetical protein